MTTQPSRKRLIEVAFPLRNCHTTPAGIRTVAAPILDTPSVVGRRLLSACRTFIYAFLVDDPNSGVEREELPKEVGLQGLCVAPLWGSPE